MPDPSTRERLLDAAWATAVSSGVEELTLAEVAAGAGVSRQAVYLHFSNRSTLLVEMARRIDHTSGFRGRLKDAREDEPRRAFRRVLQEWFDYIPTILPVHRALEAGALAGGVGADAYNDGMGAWRDGLLVDIARLAEAGALSKEWSVDDAADWVWAHVHPTTVHHLVNERGWTLANSSTRIIEMLERELVIPE